MQKNEYFDITVIKIPTSNYTFDLFHEGLTEFIFKHFDGEGRLRFKTLIKKLSSRMEIIVTFLAVLDLVKEGICRLDQQNIFGEIELVHLIIEA